MTAVSDGEGGQGKSEVKVPDGRGEKRGVGRKERDVGVERKPGDAVEAAEAKEEVGKVMMMTFITQGGEDRGEVDYFVG